MLALTHAIVGATIAKTSSSPTTGYLLAFLSHPVLDYIPHWDMRTRHTKRPLTHIILLSLADAAVGFTIGFLLFGSSVPFVQLTITMFAAQAMDWFEAPFTVLNWKFPPFSWIKAFQHKVHTKMGFPNGLWTQFILVFFLLLLSAQ